MFASEALGLIASAAVAGAINAVAGGGTILTFPTLLLFGTPPVVANATSTLALLIGTGGSAYGYRKYFPPIQRWLWRFLPVSILGGLIGGVLLTRTSEKTFSKLVPFLILFATILFLAQGIFRRFARQEMASSVLETKPRICMAITFQFAVAIYGGYFGAGIGILMLASLGFIGLQNIYEMNALKTILGSLINLVAAGWFIFSGLIDWPRAGVMTIGALGGYFLGAHFSQRISQKQVRYLIPTIGFIIAAITFYEEFFAS